MDAQGTLAIAAEVGIGLAGFSAVAVAIAASRTADDRRAEWVHLRSLLQSSFAVVLLAYLPMVLSAADVETTTLWRIASGVYLAYLGVTSIVVVRSGDRTAIGTTPWVVVVSLVGVSTGFNLYNLVAAHGAWPYLAALASGLSIAFSQFAFVIRRLFFSSATV